LTGRLLIFGPGYSGRAIAVEARLAGFDVRGTSRHPVDDEVPFDNAEAAIVAATHIVTTIPPGADGDPVLARYARAIQASPDLRWCGYLSSTVVYGNRDGGWVDEDTPPAPTQDRGMRRVEAERGWSDLLPPVTAGLLSHPVMAGLDPAISCRGDRDDSRPGRGAAASGDDRRKAGHDEEATVGGATTGDATHTATGTATRMPVRLDIFRLAGIYGPGRSAFDDLRAGRARRMMKPGHQFGRIHRNDIARAVVTAMTQDRPPGPRILNLADDHPSESAAVVAEAATLLGIDPPPEIAFADALPAMSPMARSFWAENRKIASRKTQGSLGLRWLYPSYREGLRAILAEERAQGPA
jgi:nucleoside-diphosphate-sugar epimerase